MRLEYVTAFTLMALSAGSDTLGPMEARTWEAPAFEFPLQWKGLVSGSVIDPVAGTIPSNSSGWCYTDYTQPAQRIDELWDLVSIQHSGILGYGTLSDTHLFVGKQGWFFYRNATSFQCSPQPAGILPQTWPSESFTGNGTFEGTPAAIFQLKTPLLVQRLYVALKDDGSLGSALAFDTDVPLFKLTSQTRIWSMQTLSFSSEEQQALFVPPEGC